MAMMNDVHAHLLTPKSTDLVDVLRDYEEVTRAIHCIDMNGKIASVLIVGEAPPPPEPTGPPPNEPNAFARPSLCLRQGATTPERLLHPDPWFRTSGLHCQGLFAHCPYATALFSRQSGYAPAQQESRFEKLTQGGPSLTHSVQ